MAEWLKAAVLKTVRGETPSWVRILLPPPTHIDSKGLTGFSINYPSINGILTEYLKNKGSEVHNMLFTEFNLEEAKEEWLEEFREEERERFLEFARAMLADGDSLEKIARITGLPLETLKEKLLVQ